MLLVFSLKRRRAVDLNALACEVAKREGLKVNQPIAQVEEVQRHVLDLLAEEFHGNPAGVVKLLKDRAPNHPRRKPPATG